MPGCTARSILGVAKSVTSATSRSVVLAAEVGGARSVAHWMMVSPSGEALTMPLVPAVSSSDSPTIRLGATLGRTVEAAMLMGAPTRVGAVRDCPATSKVKSCEDTVRFSTVSSISTLPL